MVSVVCAIVVAAMPEHYETSRLKLEATRQRLLATWKANPAKARADARAALLEHVDQHAFPAWKGTPWAFSGTTTSPKEGTIACGYYVTTVLEHAHVRLERVTLAQQASAFLVRSVATSSPVEWLRPKDRADAVALLQARFPGDRLLVVGFDAHAGFVRLSGQTAAFCHSSFLGDGTVTCEDPLTSPAFVSNLYVAADALNDGLLDDWLLGRPVPSVLPRRPRRT